MEALDEKKETEIAKQSPWGKFLDEVILTRGLPVIFTFLILYFFFVPKFFEYSESETRHPTIQGPDTIAKTKVEVKPDESLALLNSNKYSNLIEAAIDRAQYCLDNACSDNEQLKIYKEIKALFEIPELTKGQNQTLRDLMQRLDEEKLRRKMQRERTMIVSKNDRILNKYEFGDRYLKELASIKDENRYVYDSLRQVLERLDSSKEDQIRKLTYEVKDPELSDIRITSLYFTSPCNELNKGMKFNCVKSNGIYLNFIGENSQNKSGPDKVTLIIRVSSRNAVIEEFIYPLSFTTGKLFSFRIPKEVIMTKGLYKVQFKEFDGQKRKLIESSFNII
jgi:hypothetical protein